MQQRKHREMAAHSEHPSKQAAPTIRIYVHRQAEDHPQQKWRSTIMATQMHQSGHPRTHATSPMLYLGWTSTVRHELVGKDGTISYRNSKLKRLASVMAYVPCSSIRCDGCIWVNKHQRPPIGFVDHFGSAVWRVRFCNWLIKCSLRRLMSEC